MKSNYKRIGDYIRRVDRRNTDLKVSKLFGLSMTKEFRESTSNVVGTDMSVYKVMHKYEFACDFMSPIRVNKLPVVLKLDDEPNLVSPAYPVFEVIDRNKLDPEYLMMWFRRPEFDRYATFKCDAAIRGGYDWEELCDTLIPIPSPEKQREIVAEYNTIQSRIALNNSLIQKLEETAQAIYKHWFVAFEFPNEEGKPYKSSGGEMEFNEELKMEIPKGWTPESVYQISTFINGASFKDEDFNSQKLGLPIIKIAELKKGIDDQTDFTIKKVEPKYKITNGTILYSWSGNPETSLEVFKWFGGDALLNQHIFKLEFGSSQSKFFTYYMLKEMKPVFVRLAEGKQTTGLGHVTVADLKKLKLAYAFALTNDFEEVIRPLYNWHSSKLIQQNKLQELTSILLSRLATIESDKPELAIA